MGTMLDSRTKTLLVSTTSLYTAHPLSNLPQVKLREEGCRKTRPGRGGAGCSGRLC